MAGSASSRTMAGSLPPSSSVTRLRSGAADMATFLPVSTEPGEADLARHRVRGHPGTELVAAAHDVDHAGREDVAQQLAHLERDQRRVGRRLQHQGVAGQQRRGDLPEGERQREVPRRDGGHDAERTAGQLDVGGVVVLDDLRSASPGWRSTGSRWPRRRPRSRRRLSGLPCSAVRIGRQLRRRRQEHVGGPEQDGPPRRLVGLPVAGGLGGGVEGGVELLAGALGGLGEDLAGGGVADAEGPLGRLRLPRDGHDELGHGAPRCACAAEDSHPWPVLLVPAILPPRPVAAQSTGAPARHRRAGLSRRAS